MRTVAGELVVPAEAPSVLARRVVVEVSDVTVADASAVTLARLELVDVPVEPEGRIAFALAVPEPDPRARLAVQAHIDVAGTRGYTEGDLLTTRHVEVPVRGDVDGLVVPVALI